MSWRVIVEIIYCIAIYKIIFYTFIFVSISDKSIVFIDTAEKGYVEFFKYQSRSRANFAEAFIVSNVVYKLVEAGVKQQDIGIITPYKLQVNIILILI